MILSGRSVEALKETKTLCLAAIDGKEGPTISILPCDLSDLDQVKQLGIDTLKETNGAGVDVLINNGGLSSRSRFVDTKIEVDELLMKVNFFAGASLSKAVVPNMLERRSGAIIWISSVQGLCEFEKNSRRMDFTFLFEYFKRCCC